MHINCLDEKEGRSLLQNFHCPFTPNPQILTCRCMQTHTHEQSYGQRSPHVFKLLNRRSYSWRGGDTERKINLEPWRQFKMFEKCFICSILPALPLLQPVLTFLSAQKMCTASDGKSYPLLAPHESLQPCEDSSGPVMAGVVMAYHQCWSCLMAPLRHQRGQYPCSAHTVPKRIGPLISSGMSFYKALTCTL